MSGDIRIELFNICGFECAILSGHGKHNVALPSIGGRFLCAKLFVDIIAFPLSRDNGCRAEGPYYKLS